MKAALRIVWSGFVLINLTMSCIAQENSRPARGSIQFGAQSPPIEAQDNVLQTLNTAFSRIAETVVPSVVSVVPSRTDTLTPRGGFFSRFFRRKFSSPFRGRTDPQQIQGLGSGFIVSREGHILTNYHVVAGSQQVEIHLNGERPFQARVLGTDSLSDVAVLLIIGDIPENLPVAFLGNSDELNQGDWVAAIGHPFNLVSTITSGIVSGLDRRVEAGILYQDFIQTDAAINPGNSGGPLVDIQGAVIGMNTLIFSQTGGFMGIGMAIPINLARDVMEDLVYEGVVIRGWIGVSAQDLTPEHLEQLDDDITSGALVTEVIAGQPAAQAGIRPGDIIVSLENEPITSASDLTNKIAAVRPGSEVRLGVIRDGRRMNITVRVIRRRPR